MTALAIPNPLWFQAALTAYLILPVRDAPNPGGLENRGDLERVEYVFEDGRLIRRALSQAFPAAETPVRERVLLDDLQSCDIKFQFGGGDRDVLELTAATAVTEDDENIFVNPTALIAPDYITLELVFSNGDEMVQYFELSI